MRVFVTGAAGFIGRHLIENWVGQGDTVVALSRSPQPSAPKVEWVQGDLEHPEPWRASLKGTDAVIHCAALVDPIDDEARANAVNHLATVSLAKLAAEEGVRDFVFLSSIAAIGRQWNAGLVSEDVGCRPHTPYARSKYAAERGLLGLQRKSGRTIIVRPPTVYGPGDLKGNFLGLARAARSPFFVVPGGGRNRISFCHVTHLVEAIRAILKTDDASGVFHVADSMETTFGGVVSTIARTLKVRHLPVPFPLAVARPLAAVLERLGEVAGFNPPLTPVRLDSIASDFAFDLTKLFRTGYRPRMSSEQGMVETLRWYQAQGLL